MYGVGQKIRFFSMSPCLRDESRALPAALAVFLSRPWCRNGASRKHPVQLTCQNFDLCGSCYERGVACLTHVPEHAMTALEPQYKYRSSGGGEAGGGGDQDDRLLASNAAAPY